MNSLPVAPHPTAAELAAFADGRLRGRDADAVEAHIAACAVCAERIAAAPEGGLLALARQAELSPTPLFLTPTPVPVVVTTPEFPSALRDHPRYRLDRLIGRGGMGEVYLAEHRVMRRAVAVKVLHPRFTASADAVERFRREVHAAAKLHHPNIVQAFDAEQVDGTTFLVMEYVAGRTLAERVKADGPLPVADACEAVRQTARGLQHAYERGMVHRDVKPDNLMWTHDGVVKILDFGLARSSGPITGLTDQADTTVDAMTVVVPISDTGLLVGTPDYLAPEQARSPSAADTRADIYALGCTLFFLLTGRVPFPARSIADKLKAHAAEGLPLDRLPAEVPTELRAVLRAMTAADPAARPATPAAVAAAVAPFCPQPPRRRRLVRLVVGVAALVFAGVAVAVGTARLSRNDPPVGENLPPPRPGEPARPAPGFLPVIATPESLTTDRIEPQLSADGRWVAISPQSTIPAQARMLVYDAFSGRLAHALPTKDLWFRGQTFQNDGRLFALAEGANGADRHRVWDVTAGTDVEVKADVPPTGWQSYPRVSADGRRRAVLAFGSVTDYAYAILDAATGRRLFTVPSLAPAFIQLGQHRFTADGKRFVCADMVVDPGKPKATHVRQFDADTGAQLSHLKVPYWNAIGFGLSGDGGTVVLIPSRARNQPRVAEFWDAATGTKTHAQPFGRWGLDRTVRVSDDGRLAVARTHDVSVVVSDLNTGHELLATPKDSGHLPEPTRFSFDGSAAAAWDGKLQILHLPKPPPAVPLDPPPLTPGQALSWKWLDAKVTGLEMSADGARLVVASAGFEESQETRTHDARTGRLTGIAYRATKTALSSSATGDDGSRRVALAPDGTFALTRLGVPEPTVLARLPANTGGFATVTQDGRHAAAATTAGDIVVVRLPE